MLLDEAKTSPVAGCFNGTAIAANSVKLPEGRASVESADVDAEYQPMMI